MTLSKPVTVDKKSPTLAAETLVPRLREGALIGVLAVFIYLLVALVSYSSMDPSWSDTGAGHSISNLGGPTGAWLADVFYSLFGYMAYLFPLMLGYRSWLLFRERYRQGPFNWANLFIRIAGLIMVMVASTGLATIGDYHSSDLPFGDGGALGQAMASSTVSAFSIFGGRLILLSLLLFGMTIFTDISWLRLMDKLGALALRVSSYIRDKLIQRWRSYREKKNQKKVQQERKVVITKQIEINKTKKPPLIKPMPKQQPERSERKEREKQQPLFESVVTGTLPPLTLLNPADHSSKKGYSTEALEALSKLLEHKLKDFGVIAEVVEVFPGPVITRFEIQPGTGVKVSKIVGIAKDIARSLAVISVRVVEVIPGKPVVGIEIPNEDRAIVNFHDVLSSKAYEDSKSPLTMALGHDIAGEPVVADLAKMPHLLVAGTTGAGKSVLINVMILSLLYKSGPEDVRFILVDPKVIELTVYNGIPHLLTPVITDMSEAANGLRWCVAEMERRYKLLAALGVRNLAGFNRKVAEAKAAGEPIMDPFYKPDENYIPVDGVEPPKLLELEKLPAIVVVIDEFADMIMTVGKKVEELIARIAQKARAAGIHLILGTQRPSVDVITGLIKANVPTRMACQVSSRVDSRTILDQGGAEQLLGKGDMLYLPPGTSLPIRVHGAFVDDDEVHRVVADWKHRGEPSYIQGLLDDGASNVIPGIASEGGDGGADEADVLYDEALHFVTSSRRASISAVQRKLRIGYNRAARLIETMESAGVVSEMGHNGAREVLAPSPVE
ncbi:MAG: S-DNA-T family DNA segregation ATPase FtsK/SpoIIIE [Pseudohongiellaceae bacterium]